jgi:hypothetical protein
LKYVYFALGGGTIFIDEHDTQSGLLTATPVQRRGVGRRCTVVQHGSLGRSLLVQLPPGLS